MFEIITKLASNILGSKNGEGENQFLELFKGQKEKQREFELQLEDHLRERIQIAINDRQDARSMQVEALKQSDTFSKRFVYYLTIGILAITSVLALFPIFFEIPAGSEAMLTRATDFFYMIAGGSIIGYFFGTNVEKL